MTIAILFAIFIILLFIGMPVAFAIGIAGTAVLFIIADVPMTIIPQKLFTSVNSFPLMAVPFFILAGYMMNVGGITNRLVDFARTLVGHFAGGLAQVNVLTSMLFAGISGSASADASAIGSTLIPAMLRDGYSKSFSVSVTAASATIGPIIPPSIVMVIYGSMTNVSIGALFIAGIIPGIMIGIAQMITVRHFSIKRGYKAEQRVPFSEVISKFKDAIWALFGPVIILGGILSGIFTATEAGVIAAVYAFVVGVFVYKEIKLREIKQILLDSTIMTSVPIIILGMAGIFGWVLAREQFSGMLIELVSGLGASSMITLLAVVAVLLIVGLFIESLAAMIIFVPVLTPLVTQFGWDPIHFAMIVVISMLIGTVTPPVGIQLYIAAAIAKIPVSKVHDIWAFVLSMVVVLLLIIFIPSLATYLPEILLK